MKKITDFLKTKTSKKDLKIALSVLNEFKRCESDFEYFEIPWSAWVKLEQLEEFLQFLVNKKELKKDTLEYIKRKL